MKNLFKSLLLWLVVPMSVAMSQDTSRQKQPKLEKALPSVYITFECAGSREARREGESNQGVWLRLHNNLRWTLIVPGFDPKVPGFTIPTTLAAKSRADEVVLYYEVEDTRLRRGRTRLSEVSENSEGSDERQVSRIPAPPIGYRMTDLVKTISLAPGRSLLFSIPSEHLTRHLALNLSFQFRWEGSMDKTEHRVYFYGSDVPAKEVRQCR
jgi:hypothetical protein